MAPWYHILPKTNKNTNYPEEKSSPSTAHPFYTIRRLLQFHAALGAEPFRASAGRLFKANTLEMEPFTFAL